MGIFVGDDTRLVVQGITGREGRFHAGRMKEYGTKVVAGTTPGRGGTDIDGVPVYDTVLEAVRETGANTSCIFVPASSAADAASEALAAGIETVVCITEGIPTLDVMSVLDAAKARGWKGRIIGPNCPGLVTCGKALVGIMPGHIFTPGPVGLVSRSGTLTYEVVNLLTSKRIGQSTCVGVGGDPIIGTNFVDCLAEFERDPETKAVVLIGEIGGQDEEDAAAFIQDYVSKPVIAFVSGRTAPPGKRMGHAGAIVSGNMGTAESKVRAFHEAGVPVADRIADIAELVARALGR